VSSDGKYSLFEEHKNYTSMINEAKTKQELVNIQELFIEDDLVNNTPTRINTLTQLISTKISEMEIRKIIRDHPDFSTDDVLYAFHKPDMGNKEYTTFEEYALSKGRYDVRKGYTNFIEIIERERKREKERGKELILFD